MEKESNIFGINIKRYRKEAGMTQEVLAEKAHMQRSTISKYEKGVLTPTLDNLEEIEKALELKSGTLAQKAAIAIPDTSALMKNKRLINLLLEDYSLVVIPDIVIIELSGFKNLKINYHSKPKDKRNKKLASQVMSMIEEYLIKYKNKVIKSNTKHYDVSKNNGVSERDQRIVELAKDIKKRYSRIVDIIHEDKDIPLLADDSINTLRLETYMARRFNMESNYKALLDLDLEFDRLDRYDMIVSELDLNAYLPNGMTLLISTIRCNDPEKVEERGGQIIPEPKIQAKIKFLLENGADVNKTDCHQYCHTPLEHCIERYNPNFKEFCVLLDYGADYNKCSMDETQPGHKRISEINEGNTPLMIACFLGKEEWVRKLCSYPDICINSQDCNGYTPLIKCAVARWNNKNQNRKTDNYERIYNFLKDEMHADALIRDRNNKTAQWWWECPTELEEENND